MCRDFEVFIAELTDLHVLFVHLESPLDLCVNYCAITYIHNI